MKSPPKASATLAATASRSTLGSRWFPGHIIGWSPSALGRRKEGPEDGGGGGKTFCCLIFRAGISTASIPFPSSRGGSRRRESRHHHHLPAAHLRPGRGEKKSATLDGKSAPPSPSSPPPLVGKLLCGDDARRAANFGACSQGPREPEKVLPFLLLPSVFAHVRPHLQHGEYLRNKSLQKSLPDGTGAAFLPPQFSCLHTSVPPRGGRRPQEGETREDRGSSGRGSICRRTGGGRSETSRRACVPLGA